MLQQLSLGYNFILFVSFAAPCPWLLLVPFVLVVAICTPFLLYALLSLLQLPVLGYCCIPFITVATICPRLLLNALCHCCNNPPPTLGYYCMSFVTVARIFPLLLLHALWHCCNNLQSVIAECALSLLQQISPFYC